VVSLDPLGFVECEEPEFNVQTFPEPLVAAPLHDHVIDSRVTQIPPPTTPKRDAAPDPVPGIAG
jgi:hypothetical protein